MAWFCGQLITQLSRTPFGNEKHVKEKASSADSCQSLEDM